MSASDRKVLERDRLRKKRSDATYLAEQRKRRAAQMAEMRRVRGRGKNGECWDCKNKAMKGCVYCWRCRERNRGYRARHKQ